MAPSLRIMGGHSVQADRLLDGWRGDPDVEAWLVPIDPRPPGVLRAATKVKYLRTLVVQSCYLPQLARELMRADVVHVFAASYWSFLLAPAPAVLLARAMGKPVVLNYHSGEAPDHLRRSPTARFVVRRASRTIVPSAFLETTFRTFGLDAAVVPNTIDTTRFQFRARDPLRPRLLSTRNLTYPYNVACTLRAFARIQQQLPDAALTLVGDGPDWSALRRLAAAHGLRHIVFTGRIEPRAMPDIYAAHDIYLQSPDIDNMPLSVLEAFASGLPVVSTDVGGMPAILRHERDGLLCPRDDDDALASAVLRLLDRPDAARAMAQSARSTLDVCSWNQVRDAWLQTYRSVLPARGTPAVEVRA